MTEKVTIERAAIWIGSTIYSLPRPNRHHNIMWWLSNLGITSGQMHEQGFVDSRGHYQGRETAAQTALAAGQVEKLISPPLLYSEDLWEGGADLPSCEMIRALAEPAARDEKKRLLELADVAVSKANVALNAAEAQVEALKGLLDRAVLCLPECYLNLRADIAAALANSPQKSEPLNAVGAAEAEVGRYVYRRIETLMDAKPGTEDAAELEYLAKVAEAVEELGEEACAASALADFPTAKAEESSGQAGWVLVPPWPTEPMQRAFDAEYICADRTWADAYRAMLNAAPAPEEARSEQAEGGR